MFRYLQAFEELFHSEGIDTITGHDGVSYSVMDLRRLYDLRGELLTPQRSRAIEYFLYLDMPERDAALAMGLSRDTPVAIYATQGLRVLAVAWDAGVIWRKGDFGDLPALADAAA